MITETIILSVAQLNRHIKTWLEQEMGEVCVEGEISNLAKPSSGHFYFTLKDSLAQVRCVYFRNRHENGSHDFQNGQQVIARGMLSLYEARGDYQLIIEELKQSGEGDLFKQFELLKKKLASIGLFENSRKRELPKFPLTIGIVTSTNAAALKDVLTTLARRFPIAKIVIYPSEVQGKLAPKQLVEALQLANQQKRCDVLILARGGGSMEDLWAYNDEQLAFTIANSSIPIVSGVGHETDFTIADFVADLRAATPTAAAEAVSPNIEDLVDYFQRIEIKMGSTINRLLQYKRLIIEHQIQKIASPGRLILSHWQTLDFLKTRLLKAIQKISANKRQYLLLLNAGLTSKNPSSLVHFYLQSLTSLQSKMVQLQFYKIEMLKEKLWTQMATLHAVSPLATLERGYSIVTRESKIISNAELLQKGDKVVVQLAIGKFQAKVTEVN